MKKIIPLAILLAATQIACSDKPAEINQVSVTSDVTYLASDELEGRGMFTPGITKAAEFIAKRFKEAGLVPLEGLKGYEQPFSLYNLKPKAINVSLNGFGVDAKMVAVATNDENLVWKDLASVALTIIGKDDDIRAKIGELNILGGSHFVLVDPIHQRMFARYQGYFAGGLNKFEINTQQSLVMVVTEQTDITAIDINIESELKEQALANVVGVLPGKSKEVVLFSAHYDHLGVDEKAESDKIFNGADDDASGTAAIMNLAQYYHDQGGNERTLIFSAFTAEEIGGYGSKYFSTHIDSDNIAAMVNIEMIGKPSKFGAGKFWMTGFERSNLGPLMNESLKASNTEVYPDPYPKQRLFYRSDNATLARLGVPAHSFSSTQLDKDEHYHKASDDIASLDLVSMTQVIKSIAIGSQGLVDGKATPTRVDTSKVNKKGLIF
jgi:aminopeptidase YwaD